MNRSDLSFHHIMLPVDPASNASVARLAALLQAPEQDTVAVVGEYLDVPVIVAYDALRSYLRAVDDTQSPADTAARLSLIDAELGNCEDRNDGRATVADLRTAVMQLVTHTHLEGGNLDDARLTAATALTRLVQEPRRKDIAFLETLASLLYDVAAIHTRRSEFRQAEREIEKAVATFGRLAKNDPARYGSAHIIAQEAFTSICSSRTRQAALLTKHQAATTACLQMMGEGTEEAALKLVESLYQEGLTLARMDRHREAVGYYTRALKYLTRVKPQFDLRQLQMSIDLGESLLEVKASREKGVHLLNTMLHKATKLGAVDEHRRMVNILLNAKNRRLDILGWWHRVFPR